MKHLCYLLAAWAWFYFLAWGYECELGLMKTNMQCNTIIASKTMPLFHDAAVELNDMDRPIQTNQWSNIALRDVSEKFDKSRFENCSCDRFSENAISLFFDQIRHFLFQNSSNTLHEGSAIPVKLPTLNDLSTTKKVPCRYILTLLQ